MREHETKLAAIAIAGMLLGSVPFSMLAGPPPQSFPYHITTRQQAETIKPGARIAMACSKCKTVQVMDVDKEKGFLGWFKPKTKHLCPGCGGYVNFREIGVPGKGTRIPEFVHTCSKCGDKSVYCCATQPGERTKGM